MTTETPDYVYEAVPPMALVREPGGPDGQGRESFTLYWTVDAFESEPGRSRNRGQCFRAVVAKYLEKGCIECPSEEAAKALVGWKVSS